MILTETPKKQIISKHFFGQFGNKIETWICWFNSWLIGIPEWKYWYCCVTIHRNDSVGEQRAFSILCWTEGLYCSGGYFTRSYAETDLQYLQIKQQTDLGVLFIDGFSDRYFSKNKGNIGVEAVCSVALVYFREPCTLQKRICPFLIAGRTMFQSSNNCPHQAAPRRRSERVTIWLH